MDRVEAVKIARRIEGNPLLTYLYGKPGAGGMAPFQERFHKSQSSKRALIAANKLGKTYLGGASSWLNLLGRSPFRKVPPPGSTGWLLAPDLTTGWATVSAAMRELEPPGVLHPSCYYVDGIGYTYRGRKIIALGPEYGGGIMVGKGCEQSVLSLEGARVAWAWVDEPPKEQHLRGLRARLSYDMAPIILTCTPIGRPVGYLKCMLEGDEELGIDKEPGWYVDHVELTVENAPHRDPESIRVQREECSPWEFNQRILSQWEGLTPDRWVTGFTEDNIFTDTEAPTEIEGLGLGIDHGERPGKSVFYIVAYSQDAVWVLAEYSNTESSTPLQEATAVKEMLDRWGLDLYDITEARGDSNSAGRLGMGWSMNDVYQRSFAHLTKSSRSPFRIEVPYKRRGSVNARVRLISNACIDGRLRVHNSCTRLISALRHWRGQANSTDKDCFDSMGYIAEVFLNPALTQDNSGKLIVI